MQSDSRDIEENLFIEEEILGKAERDELYLFFWRNDDCVVIGRHQDPEAECRLETAKELGIRIARRCTGGGAVFQDPGNLNVSFIASADSLDEEICEEILLKALIKCGVHARKTGRNDLVLDDMDQERSETDSAKKTKTNGRSGAVTPSGKGGKFSGSASRETPQGNFLFHATLMFAVDLDRLEAVLNVTPDKLARHRIASVRSRVTNLCEHYTDLKMETVMQAIIAESCALLTDVQ